MSSTSVPRRGHCEAATQSGFTLVEVMVAVALIGVALFGLLNAVPVSSSGVQTGNQLSVATFLAEQRLEEVRNALWTQTPTNDCLGISATGNSAPTSPVAVGAPSCNGGPAITFPDEANVNGWNYRRTVRITDCSIAPGCGAAPNNIIDPNLRLVTVSVSYTPATTAASSAGLSILVARR